ncbi:MAG: 50S ribosomal protein L11 methyltransferase [Caldilineaceae bacterium]
MTEPIPEGADNSELLELAVACDAEAAEAVSELFNRYNGGGYDDDNEAGEAGGGGAVIEATGFDDERQEYAGAQHIVVKTYLKPGARGAATRRLIEEGLWRLSLLYPIPEAQVRPVREEDWAQAWKKFYKPIRIGKRVVLKPTWEPWEGSSDDLLIHLDPGMAFGTGMHPTTRLCIAALEEYVQPGDSVLDIGTGSGVLAIVALRLGAGAVLATDIDPLAVRVATENAELNGYATVSTAAAAPLEVRKESVPAGVAGGYRVVVANILAEVLAKLFDGAYGNTPLAEPLAHDGVMILSGILEDRAHLVDEAAQRHGLLPAGRLQENDWVALIYRRDPAPAL